MRQNPSHCQKRTKDYDSITVACLALRRFKRSSRIDTHRYRTLRCVAPIPGGTDTLCKLFATQSPWTRQACTVPVVDPVAHAGDHGVHVLVTEHAEHRMGVGKETHV